MTRYWLWDESNVTPSEVYDVEYETPPPDATILVPESAVEEARREERERCLRILEPFVEPMLVGDEDVDAVAWEVIEEQLLPHPNQTEEG